MIKLIIRILIAIVLSIGLSAIGVKGNTAVLQTLFTVLGIVFSISMSLLVSFNLSKVLNPKFRKALRESISNTRNMLLYDFGISAATLVTALIWRADYLVQSLKWFTIDVLLIANIILGISLIYEIYNFRRIHSLNMDIEDAIVSESSSKK